MESTVTMHPFMEAPDWLCSEKRHLKAVGSLCVFVCAHTCECALEASIQLRMPSLIALSVISFETGSFTEPGAHESVRLVHLSAPSQHWDHRPAPLCQLVHG